MKKETTYQAPADAAKSLNNKISPDQYHWEFFRDQSGRWRWLQADFDGVTKGASKRSFDDYGECVENAIFSGFGGNRDKVLFVPDLP